MPRQYPAGGRYNGQYAYPQQPTTSQYESFFNPIPLDFLQEQLGSRQGKYDAAFAGTLGAQDELNQVQVGMSDIASKNQIVKEGIGNIDKIVNDKYGGDWSKASKEIARSVTQMRANPFWNAQKEVEKKRAAYQTQVDKFGPNALMFGADPRNVSTLDEQGQVRKQDQFAGEVVEKGDYIKTARELMAGLTPDKNTWGLTREEIDNFLGYGEVSQVTEKKIREMAQSPEMQEALLSRHGEIRRSGELSETQQKQHGFYDKTPEQFAEEQLFAAGRSAISRQVTKKVVADPIATQRAATKAANVPIRATTNSSDVVGHYYEGQLNTRDVTFNDKGQVASTADRIGQKTKPTTASMMPVFTHYGTMYPGIDMASLAGKGVNGWRDIMNHVRTLPPGPQNPLGAIVDAVDSVEEFALVAQERKDNEYMKKINEMHPELQEFTPQEAASLKQTADEKQAQQSSLIHSFGTDWQNQATKEFVYNTEGSTYGRMFDQELFLDGSRVAGDDKQAQFAELLDFKPNSKELDDAIKSARISDMSFTGNTPGEQIMTIKDSDGNNRTVEIAPSREVQEVTTPSWTVGEIIRSGGQSQRIQEFQVHGQTAQQDAQGNWFVPSTGAVDVDGQRVQVWYYVNSDIVPSSEKDNMSGEYKTDIRSVIFVPGEGEPREVQANLTLGNVVDFDKAEAGRYIATKKNETQKPLN